jgi:hypothetical protein
VAFGTRPVTPDRIGDLVTVASPDRRASHCWCLSHRLSAREVSELGNGSRESAFRVLCGRRNPPGLIGYDDGAAEYAASHGAPAVESYPVDPGSGRMDLTMVFVGTRAMFEKAGFEVAGSTDAMAGKLPRLVMRRML